LHRLTGEINVVNDAFEEEIGFLQSAQRLVQAVANVLVQVPVDVVPTGRRRNKKMLIVPCILGGLLSLFRRGTRLQFLSDKAFTLLVKHIGAALQEQHPKNKVAEFGMVHLTA